MNDRSAVPRLDHFIAVFWKEWRENLQISRGRGLLRGLLIPVIVLGGLLPWQIGPAWVAPEPLGLPLVLVFWCWFPLLLTSALTADSFAGERERHTLETLLSTPLSEASILLGKSSAAVLNGWLAGLLIPTVGWVTVNLAHGHGALLLYSGTTLVGGSILSLGTAGLAGSAGILISLRSATVRAAQQTLSLAVLGVGLIPVFLPRLLPAAARGWFLDQVSERSSLLSLSVPAAGLFLLDTLFLVLAWIRFRASRMSNSER